jgi:hypothetical protein
LNLGDIFNNSFDYAKKLFSNIGRLVILIILNVIPIVNLITVGYFAKAIRESPGSSDVPKLEGYGEMFVQGLKVAVAIIIYMIIPMILIISGAFTLALRFAPYWMNAPRGLSMWALGPIGIILVIIGVIVGFLIAIIAVMGIVHMIKSHSFGKAFAFSEILKIIGKIGWGKYLGWLIIMFVLGMIVGWIGAIPYIGWLISLIISPIYGVFAARSATLIYTEGSPGGQYPPPPPAPAYPTPASVAAPAGMYCKYCGAPSSAEATYCQNCGQKIR